MKKNYEAPETVEIKSEVESLLGVVSPIESEPIPNGTDEDAGAKSVFRIIDEEE